MVKASRMPDFSAMGQLNLNYFKKSKEDLDTKVEKLVK